MLQACLNGARPADTPGLPILLHGENASAWPVLALAAELGLDTRIGMEDTLLLPDGTAAGNSGLVAAATAILTGAA